MNGQIVNKNIMNHQAQKKPETQNEDEIISKIKQIALEIFDTPLQGLKREDFTQGCIPVNHFKTFQANHRYQNQNQERKFSYTERRLTEENDQCKSEWIDYRDYENKNQQIYPNIENNKGKSNTKQETNKKQKDNKINKKTVVKPQIKKAKQVSKNPDDQKRQAKKIVQKKQEPNIEVPKQKINIKRIDQYGFMQQHKKLKPSALQYVYSKQKQQQEQFQRTSQKSEKTLEQLYQNKEPLYEKFKKQKQKRTAQIYQSRVAEEKKQIGSLKSGPQINKNIKVEGNFQDRIMMGLRKAEQNKLKIMSDMFKNSTFQPQINKSKYNQVGSIVKKNWSIDNIPPLFEGGDQTQFYIVSQQEERTRQLKQKQATSLKNSRQIQKKDIKQKETLIKSPKNGIKVDENSQKSPKNKKINNQQSQFYFKLRNTQQLSNILQLDDAEE